MNSIIIGAGIGLSLVWQEAITWADFCQCHKTPKSKFHWCFNEKFTNFHSGKQIWKVICKVPIILLWLECSFLVKFIASGFVTNFHVQQCPWWQFCCDHWYLSPNKQPRMKIHERILFFNELYSTATFANYASPELFCDIISDVTLVFRYPSQVTTRLLSFECVDWPTLYDSLKHVTPPSDNANFLLALVSFICY